MNLTDNHVLYLCNAIKNMNKYLLQKQQQMFDDCCIEKHTKQKPGNKKLQKSNRKIVSKNVKNDIKPIYTKNKKAQKEIERQLSKMKSMKSEGKVEIQMQLQSINLSVNNVTDKYLPLLLRTVKKYMPNLKSLDLSSNRITNRSLSTIMKYNIRTIQIDLSSCKGVTLKALNKHKRTHYEENGLTADRYHYCKDMVYFLNNKEEQIQKNEHIVKYPGYRGSLRDWW
eukprot:249641_1